MRISTKGRYGLAAMVYLAQRYESGAAVPLSLIAQRLELSKIYLEQVFSLLKRRLLVSSIKGTQGGYRLTRSPSEVTAFDVLMAVELALFERTEAAVFEKAPEIEAVLRASVFDVIDTEIETVLKGITLRNLVTEVEKNSSKENFMFFI